MTNTFSLGAASVSAIFDLAFSSPLNKLFPKADPATIDDCGMLGSLSPAGEVILQVRSWLIRAGGRNILVDACVGAEKDRSSWPEWHQRDGATYQAGLAAAGLAPSDIDIVFCTHLHADHVGWNTVLHDGRWVPTFTNARTLVGRTEYDHFAQATSGTAKTAFADSVLPVMEAGLMDLVDDGYELAKDFSLTLTPGHSPGHMCLNAPGAVFCGDVIHSPIQLADPDLACAFDFDRDAARKARKALLETVAEAGSLLVPTHFPDPGRCWLQRSGERYIPILP
ncbi:MAG: MBL fold metallo-hydrolase [Pseudomonadota bacterium]